MDVIETVNLSMSAKGEAEMTSLYLRVDILSAQELYFVPMLMGISKCEHTFPGLQNASLVSMTSS